MAEEISPAATPEQMQQELDKIAETLRLPFTMLLNGAVKSYENVAPEIIIMTMCRTFATIIGFTYRGKDDGVREFRERCRSIFSNTLHAVPVTPLPTEAPPQGTPEILIPADKPLPDGE